MLLFAIIALLAGILYGTSGLSISFLDLLSAQSNSILWVLMVCVGISVGLHHGLLAKIRAYRLRIFVLPLGIIAGSCLGGLVCQLLMQNGLAESLAITGGLGWYSLTGVLVTELSGAHFGSIAFFSNLLRELFSFFSIPLIAKYLNYPTCIAPAGATSEDTTLPMMIRYTNDEAVVFSVMNGVICSALVPVLISFCYRVL